MMTHTNPYIGNKQVTYCTRTLLLHALTLISETNNTMMTHANPYIRNKQVTYCTTTLWGLVVVVLYPDNI